MSLALCAPLIRSLIERVCLVFLQNGLLGDVGDCHRVSVLGVPGSGKTTHAKQLAAVLRVPCLSSEDLFASGDSEPSDVDTNGSGDNSEHESNVSGTTAHDGQSDLQTPEENEDLGRMVQRLQQEDCRAGFVLDSVPTTLAEMRALHEAKLLPLVAMEVEVRGMLSLEQSTLQA